MVQKISISNKLFLKKKILTAFTEILSSTTVSNIDNMNIFIVQQISILGCFLKDHVTLKTEVMML